MTCTTMDFRNDSNNNNTIGRINDTVVCVGDEDHTGVGGTRTDRTT
jgi:hypothetical protein